MPRDGFHQVDLLSFDNGHVNRRTVPVPRGACRVILRKIYACGTAVNVATDRMRHQSDDGCTAKT
jgi:hypothetical protein